MRNQTRRDDRPKESGDSGTESETKRGRLVRAALKIWVLVNKQNDYKNVFKSRILQHQKTYMERI